MDVLFMHVKTLLKYPLHRWRKRNYQEIYLLFSPAKLQYYLSPSSIMSYPTLYGVTGREVATFWPDNISSVRLYFVNLHQYKIFDHVQLKSSSRKHKLCRANRFIDRNSGTASCRQYRLPNHTIHQSSQLQTNCCESFLGTWFTKHHKINKNTNFQQNLASRNGKTVSKTKID